MVPLSTLHRKEQINGDITSKKYYIIKRNIFQFNNYYYHHHSGTFKIFTWRSILYKFIFTKKKHFDNENTEKGKTYEGISTFSRIV